jgi:sugar O-acyltransferase (sialic acid O-acetyltransferase NeuD family)
VKPIVVAGGGGHARSVIEVLRQGGRYDPVAVTDPSATGAIDGVPVAGTDEALRRLHREEGIPAAVPGVGGIGSNDLRRQVFQRLDEIGFELPAVVHPAATVAATAAMGAGSVVLAGAVVGAGATVGRNVIVNTGALIEHDVVLEDDVHVATGAALGGNVHVGRGAHVGLGASVMQGVSIGQDAVVGAGAVVIGDVPDGVTVVGVPAAEK